MELTCLMVVIIQIEWQSSDLSYCKSFDSFLKTSLVIIVCHASFCQLNIFFSLFVNIYKIRSFFPKKWILLKCSVVKIMFKINFTFVFICNACVCGCCRYCNLNIKWSERKKRWYVNIYSKELVKSLTFSVFYKEMRFKKNTSEKN